MFLLLLVLVAASLDAAACTVTCGSADLGDCRSCSLDEPAPALPDPDPPRCCAGEVLPWERCSPGRKTAEKGRVSAALAKASEQRARCLVFAKPEAVALSFSRPAGLPPLHLLHSSFLI